MHFTHAAVPRILVAAAPSFPWLVAGRLLGGVAGAGYSPNIQVGVCTH